ncbi:MAG TPA: YfiR family protein [Caulobacteraceae bacterium]|jgi:hypothetical protein|nr:YfiR family protein [Caulobacteraceae bacterium]
MNRRRLAGLLAATSCVLNPALASDAWAQTAAAEYSVKAAYLYKFAPFVQWPPASLAPGAPLEVCVVGPDPFGRALDIAASGQTVGDHKVEVRRLARVEGRPNCHVMYVRKSVGQSVADALATVRGAPVLTVTDAADGEGARGILHLVVAEKRVRFEVDPAAAAENGLSISSKLLDLALTVRKGAGA